MEKARQEAVAIVQAMTNKAEAVYYQEEDEDSIATMKDGKELASSTGSTVVLVRQSYKNLQLSIITNLNDNQSVTSSITWETMLSKQS